MVRKQVKFNVNPLLEGPSLHDRRTTGSPYRELRICDIDVDPEQPRKVFDEETIKELAESIKEHGVLSPILVRLCDGGAYRIIAGERRYRACKLLGLETIPAIIQKLDADDSQRLLTQLVENLQREDLNPIERAVAVSQLRDMHALSIRDIASRLGVSKSSVQRSLEIIELPQELRDALAKGASESKVLLIGQVSDEKARNHLLSQIESVSREDLEALIKSLLSDGGLDVEVSHRGTKKKLQSKMSKEDIRIAEDLQRCLGAKVEIIRKSGDKEKGKLVVEFYSSDDLNEIFRRLAS